MPTNDIRQQSIEDLQAYFEQIEKPKYTASQVWEWIWKKSAQSFVEMTNLPVDTREQLAQDFVFRPLQIKHQQTSSDGTIKLVFELHDTELVEGVLIPQDERMTACISSQVGCSLSCKFCATGYMDRKRNLSIGEIYDQIIGIHQIALSTYQKPLSNVVMMGMGEPLLNYKNVLSAIHRVTDHKGLNMSSKRITISTAGIVKAIRQLGKDQEKSNLALSLHAADDEKRNQIMPINESNSLKDLVSSLLFFYEETGTPITLEYTLLKNFNDSPKDAKNLLGIARKIPCKVNLISYNPIEESSFLPSATDKTSFFVNYLRKGKVNVSVRRSRGQDIDAACGQLANKTK